MGAILGVAMAGATTGGAGVETTVWAVVAVVVMEHQRQEGNRGNELQ